MNAQRIHLPLYGVFLAVAVCATPGTAAVLTFFPTDDTYIRMKDPDNNYGSSDRLVVGNRYGHPSHGDDWGVDSLVRFDLSPIAPSSAIISATLYIYYYQYYEGFDNPAGRELSCYRVTSDWNEDDVTWNTGPTYADEATFISIVPPQPTVWMTWDVLSDVQAFVDDAGPMNYGWRIRDEEPWGWYDIPWTMFRSKEFGEFTPYLEIEIEFPVTIEDDYSYPQFPEHDYAVGTGDISFSDSNPAPGETVSVAGQVHNYGLCRARGPYGWYSPTGRSCWGEWDLDYPMSGTVELSYRCRDHDATVDWRVELDGVHLADVSVPPTPMEGSWKLVTIHDVPITAGPHTIFLGTYQMDQDPDYSVDWVQIGDVRVEAETYDRTGGNDPNPDFRGLSIYPMGANPPESVNLTVQIWDGHPSSGGTLLVEDFVGDTNLCYDGGHDYPENNFECHYIENDGVGILEVDWTPSEPGTYDICVVVDPHDVLEEIDEENNVACRSIIVNECHANEFAKLTASDHACNDWFGHCVCISGDVAVIGAPGDATDVGTWGTGSAYVYRFDGATWVEEAKLTASDAEGGEMFGYSCSIGGDTIVIGAPWDDDPYKDCGSAYVFRFDNCTGWSCAAKLIPENPAPDDYFGHSVSISGDVAVVGGLYPDENCAYGFVKPPDGWNSVPSPINETCRLFPSEPCSFGHSVSISGNVAVIGARGEPAYVYEMPAGGCVDDMTEETCRLSPSDGAPGDEFGWSVSISGDVLVIGAWMNDGKGCTYVFKKPPGGWVDMTETAKLTASDAAPSDRFGWSVSVSGDIAVAGAWEKDDDEGAAYVFKEPPGGWVDMTETAKLAASDAEPWDRFGWSVSISGHRAIVGAYLNDDADPEEPLCGSGSAYVFHSLSDCQPNDVLDICDIALGTSLDVNENGVPDECVCTSDEACKDGDNCTEDWCDGDPEVGPEGCEHEYRERKYADIYPVPDGDGAVEGFDILCVLDAANDLDTYGCMTVLPSGYKAGDIYPCNPPDGAVEGFDILAVLDAANDINWCDDPCP